MYRNSIFYKYISLQYSGLGRTAGGWTFLVCHIWPTLYPHPISPTYQGRIPLFGDIIWGSVSVSVSGTRKNTVMSFFQVKIIWKAQIAIAHQSLITVIILCCFKFEKLLMEDKGFYIFSPLQKRACTWLPMFNAKANTTGKFNLPGLVPCHLVCRNSAAELSPVYLLTATNIGTVSDGSQAHLCWWYRCNAIANSMPSYAVLSSSYLLTATNSGAVPDGSQAHLCWWYRCIAIANIMPTYAVLSPVFDFFATS